MATGDLDISSYLPAELTDRELFDRIARLLQGFERGGETVPGIIADVYSPHLCATINTCLLYTSPSPRDS